MPNTLPLSFQTGTLVLGVVGTTVGLNLSVMAIGRDAPDPIPEQLALVAAEEAGDPEVMQVTIDVPLPAAETVPATATARATTPAIAGQPQSQPATPWPTAPPPPPLTAAPTTPVPTVAPTAAPTAPAPTLPPTTTVPPPPTTQPETTVPPSVTEYLTYTFDGVADIVIAFHDGQELEFWSVSPEPGWAYQVEKNKATIVEVKFRRMSGDEGEAKFELELKEGQLEVKKED